MSAVYVYPDDNNLTGQNLLRYVSVSIIIIIIIIIITIIIITTTFVQGINNYTHETKQVSRIYTVTYYSHFVATIYSICNVTSHVECFLLLH